MSKKGEKIKHPLQYLMGDHREVSALLGKLGLTEKDSGAERENIFNELKNGLSLHMSLEENTIYPALEKIPETKELVSEAKKEHNKVRMIIRELENQNITTDNWMAKVQVLKENVTHHVKEEEMPDGLFDKAQSLLTQNDLENLRKDMEKYLQ